MTKMQQHDGEARGDAILQGRRLLVSLPPSNKEHAKVIIGFLEAAKVRWDVQIDVVCRSIDRSGLQSLTGSSGRFFFVPHLLTSQAWERDPEAVAATDRRIHEAELAACLPMGRLVMGAAHTVGRAFNTPVRHGRRYALVRKVLKDNSEPFRIMRRLFHFADETLAASRLDLVCTMEYAAALNSALWLAAKLHGIPCVSLRNSKIVSGQAFWSLDRKMLNSVSIGRAASKRRSALPVSDRAKAQIEAFREQPATVAYIASRWRYRAQRHVLRWHVLYARTIGREALNRFRGQDRALAETLGSRLALYYKYILMTYAHQRFLHGFDEATLAAMRYIYFPMHKEAELAQTVQATPWYDQRNTVRLLASMLPFGYRLLVREHKLNYGHRPTRYYHEMCDLPNVILIDPFDTQFKYVRYADLVVTESGSSGWEGLLLGRRVLLLSETFYEGSGLGMKVTDPDLLNSAVLKMLATPAVADSAAHDHALACTIDAEFDTAFPITADGSAAALDHLALTVGPVLRRHTRPLPAPLADAVGA